MNCLLLELHFFLYRPKILKRYFHFPPLLLGQGTKQPTNHSKRDGAKLARLGGKNASEKQARRLGYLALQSISFFCVRYRMSKLGPPVRNIMDSDYFPFSQLNISKSIESIMMKLSETTEGLNVSAYVKFQTSISFFYVKYTTRNLGSNRRIQPIQIISPIFRT